MSVKPKNPPRDQFNHFEINEHLGSLGRAQVVDAKEGLIKDVKILGLTSSNKRDYSPAAVKRASKLYEGAAAGPGEPVGPRQAADRPGRRQDPPRADRG